MENIRAKRERPGLLRQHLTAVLAAGEIGSAQADGATLGSKTLTFIPGSVRSGTYHSLMTASGPSEIWIEGGTHNMQAPPFDFLEKVFLPLIRSLGPKVEVQLERYGFYPAGGGSFRARIEPCKTLKPIKLMNRGEITRKTASAIVANLPRNIAQRELNTVADLLNWDAQAMNIIETKNSVGPGNIVFVEVVSSGLTEVFSGFGKIGKSAESVASDACESARSYLASGAAVGEHLADQLLLPLALAGGGSFTAEKLNLHARTNIDVIAKFLPTEFEVKQESEGVRIEVRASK